MTIYSQGKIYKITGTDSEGNLLTYIGSTTKEYLSQRLSKHNSNYKDYKKDKYGYMASYPILDLEDCIITLIQLYPCSCREELRMIERKYYDEYDCVNIKKPYISKEETKDKRKHYLIENANKLKEQQKQYSIENADTIKQYKQKYAIENADTIKQYRQKYAIENADRIKVKRREKALEKS